MFSKVLVSDDLGSVNQGVLSVLQNLKINDIEQVLYCDDAYLKIKKAYLDDNPFDLLITDLSFVQDHREQKFSSGEDLIIALNKEHPALKVIVYTMEDRIQKARLLMNSHNTNAYVCKGRKGLLELENAIKDVFLNNTYISPIVQQAMNPKVDLEINNFDINLIELLSHGLSQEDISLRLKEENISPSSLSSIEKRLNKLRVQFKANNAIHLVTIFKDLGLI